MLPRPKVIHKYLRKLYRRQSKRVEGKEEIVSIYLPRPTNLWVDQPLQIIHCVEIEAHRVQHRELNRKACHALFTVVVPGLRVEGERPKHE